MSSAAIAPANPRPVRERVQLMATCLCDAFFDDVAKATVEVLEYVGCEIVFPENQTCCGQPPFNSGDFAASRKVVRHNLEVFAGDDPIVIPSGSCAAMNRHGNLLQFENEAAADQEAVAVMGHRTWELSDYLVNGLGRTEWPGRMDKKIAIHHSCHTRGTGTGEALRMLLGAIEGVEIVEFGQGEQCCGFGGTFSVTFPHISKEMGTLKIDHITESEPDLIVSGDMSCLMHLGGLAEKQNRPFPTVHIAQVLRDALQSSK